MKLVMKKKVKISRPKKKKTVQKKQNATVVVRSAKQRPSAPLDKSGYRVALTQPFSAGAIGARVPDMYSFPTTTYRVTKTVQLYTNANGTCSAILMPSAFCHAWSPTGSFASGSTNTAANKFSVTSPQELDSKLAQHRIVGWGGKISIVTSALNIAGRLSMAEVPTACSLPDWKFGITTGAGYTGIGENDVNEQDTNAAFLAALGYPYKNDTTYGMSGGVSTDKHVLDESAFTAIPTHKNMGMPELQASNVELKSKLTSPSAFEFRQSTNRGLGYDVTDSAHLIIAVGHTSVKAGDASYRNLRGWSSIAMIIDGMPASQKIGEIELVFHLEGEIPVSTSTSLIAPSSRNVMVNINNFHRAIEQASNEPWFRLAKQAARLMIA